VIHFPPGLFPPNSTGHSWHLDCGYVISLEDDMTAARTVCVGLLSVFVAACTSVAPVKITAGDQCFRCRRIIADERVATETIDTNGFVAKFRGPGCMAKYIVAHPDDKAIVFVTDYATGKMMPPADALYVPVILDRNNGDSDYRAYRQQADADAVAAELQTTPLHWDAVLDKAR
jgi:hypothetical protein